MNINTGGQASEFRFDFPVNFPTNQWRVVNFGITINANQTFFPTPTSPGTVKLNASASFAGQSTSASLAWNSLDYSQAKSASSLKSGLYYGTSGSKFTVNLSYTVPQLVISPPAVCNFSFYCLITYASLPGISVTQTPPSFIDNVNVINDGGQTPPNYLDWWNKLPITSKALIAGGAILALVLIVRPSAVPTIISTSVREVRRR